VAEKLKKGWARVTFGDVVQLCRERSNDPAADGFDRYVGLEHLEPGDLKIRRWGNVADGTTFTNVFRAGQVLFGKRRAYQRKVAVADFDGVCSGDIYVLKPKNENLLSKLLPFICQTDGFFEYAIGTSAGSLSPRTNWESLASFEFALPPLVEQRRIADVLQAADHMVERFSSLKATAERVLTSLAHQRISLSHWPERTLGELLEYASDGPFGSKIKTEHYSSSGARVIRLNNIDVNRFNDEDKAFLSMDYFISTLSGYEVKAGDVVVAGLGDESIPAGRACAVPAHLGIALNKADCFCLRPRPEILPRFLAFCMNSPHGLAQSAAFSQGTTRMRLNLGNIRKMNIPTPPLPAQKKIVAELDSLLKAVHSADKQQQFATNNLNTFLRILLEAP
jgi:type I restriction enzyme S subunit